MAENVGSIRAEFVGDASSLVKAAQQAETAVQNYGKNATSSLNKAQGASRATASTFSAATNSIKGGLAQAVTGLRSMASSFSMTSEQATRMGRNLSMKVTLPLVGMGAAAIKAANDFEFSMASITGLVGVAADEVKAMEGSVRSMATQFGVSGGQAADALFFITSAGLRGEDAMGVLEQALKASAIGLGETATIADLATSALNAYGSANLSASEATDVMVATVREGKLVADELAGSMGRVLPLASAMGVGFNEVGAAFAALSRTGTNASEAATQIRGILSSLLNPSKQAEDELTRLGLSSAELRKTIKEDGLLAALGILAETFGDNEESAGLVFGNIRALSGVLDLMGANVETTNQIFANMENNLGDTNKALEAMSGTGAFKARQAVAQLKDAMISLGQAIGPVILPIFSGIAGALAKLAGAFNSLPGPIKTFVTALGGIAVISGPLLIGLGATMKAVTALKGAMAGAAGASGAGALATGLSKLLPLLANPAFLGAAAIAGAVGYAFFKMGSEADEAEERQKRLTSALRDAGEPSLALVDTVTQLAEAYAQTAQQADNAAGAIANVDEGFVANELSALDVFDSVKVAGISFEELSKVVSAGEDTFLDLAETLRQIPLTEYAEQLRYAVEDGVPFVDLLLAQLEAGKLTEQQVLAQIEAFDALAVAYQDNFILADENAEKLLTQGDALQRYTDLLGGEYFVALRDSIVAQQEAAGSLTPYLDALQLIEPRARRVEITASGMGSRLGYVGEEAFTTTGRVKDLDEVLKILRGTAENGATTFAALAAEIGITGDVLANELQLMLLDAQDSAGALFDDLADGDTTFRDLERAVRQSALQIGELVVETTNLGGETDDALGPILGIIQALYDGAEAAGFSRDKVTELIAEIGFLDQLSPEIALALKLDTSQLKAQAEQLRNGIEVAKRIGNLGMFFALTRELEPIAKLLETIGDIGPSGGGGGGRGGRGGGGGRAPEDPYAWVEDWVKDLTDFAADVINTDFVDGLITQTAPEIAKALNRVMEEATRLGVTLLPMGSLLAPEIERVTGLLGDLADQINAPETGFADRLSEAQGEVSKLKSELKGLRKALEDFQRIEMGRGPLTALEQLDAGIAKYNEMKSSLASLRQEYQAFIGADTNPLDDQINKLNDLGSSLAELQVGLEEINALGAGPSGLAAEAEELRRLKDALDSASQARTGFQQSTTESLGKIPFAARGGALFSAKRYLQKVEAFRDIITGLRDREFPPSIISDVLAAGIDGGTALGRKLLALSGTDLAEFKRVQQQIQAIAAETAQIGADVLFTADVADAEAAFKRQLSLVQQMYQQAISQAQAEFNSQQAIVQGIYEQQIAQAEQALEQQKTVVEALFQNAIAEAEAQLAHAEDIVKGLKTALEDVQDTMRDLIGGLAQFIKDLIDAATKAEGAGGAKGGTGTRPTGGTIPGTNIPIVIGTGDSGQPKAGEKVGGPDRLWGGAGGGGVVDGIYIPPGIDFGALGRRAKGGPVTGNEPYLVGELGPELFVPRSSGTIVPNDVMAMSGGAKNYTINVNVAGGQNIGREVVRAIEEYERRNGNGWRT